ncbi:hypothetical protein Hypma_002968 [Hypsizygus marmoreus]|uniref:Uncharacterized protein n=1 Tax=Hypsizygus marmoreus TaxID=39966 RepID=A0A369J726_HYPMA|nr:hypothetical protein Hypma_002968 [Hypsizygus marmoreus]
MISANWDTRYSLIFKSSYSSDHQMIKTIYRCDDTSLVDLRRIEFDAGTSNTRALSDLETCTAKDFLSETQCKLPCVGVEILRVQTVLNEIKAQRRQNVADAASAGLHWHP